MKNKIIYSILAGVIIVLTILNFFPRKSDALREDKPQAKEHVDTISMMLETEAGSGNYEMTTASSWPTEGYVFNTELSKCENGGELSWDDANKTVLMSGNVSDKCYVYFDIIPPILLADYVKSLYTGTQGVNSIYYHNGTITSGDGIVIDANDSSYRYAGSSNEVNNFVCFGSDATSCPTDNLYRIIGVFGNQVKLIKHDYANSNLLGTDGDYYTSINLDESTPYAPDYRGSLASVNTYYWNNSTNTSTWSESLLNKTNLNTNFIANIGEEWAEKIATTTWKVGGNTYDNIRSAVPATAYANEIVNPAPGSDSTTGEIEYSAKIGLMYVSDYGFAAAPSAWSKILNNYDGNDDNGVAITTINWMYMGFNDWTITRGETRGEGSSNFAFSVQYDGSVRFDTPIDSTLFQTAVRPSFNLSSSVLYKSGDGTSSNPYRIIL
mgnify:CR=1 FL=1